MRLFCSLYSFCVCNSISLNAVELIRLQGQETPIYIWYESYPTHSGEGYEGRVSRVSPDSPFGAASLNLTNIRESDQGWYECKVVFLNRSPNQHKNGSWFHLDVHAPPRFSVTPEDIIYVNLGEWRNLCTFSLLLAPFVMMKKLRLLNYKSIRNFPNANESFN
jgi:hypothetical protein